MATNEKFREADSLTLPVPPNTVAGDPLRVGTLVGVALTDRDDATGTATVRLKGAFVLNVASTVTAVGQPLYITGDGTVRVDQVTATVGSNLLYGYALATKGSAVAPIPVRIAQV